MERIIGVNPVIEVLQNKEKNIEKLEMLEYIKIKIIFLIIKKTLKYLHR